MTIHEPLVLLTDLLLAAFGGWLAWRLWRALTAADRAAQWWSYALALAALAGLVGGLYHAFAEGLPAAAASAWWLVTLLVVRAVSLAMDCSLVHTVLPAGRRRAGLTAAALKFVFFGIVVAVRPDFGVTIIDYGLSLLAWTLAALVLRRPWSGWMLAGIGLSVAAAVIQQAHWDISAHFDYDDLYHVVQAAGFYGFYRAARRLI